MINYDNPEYDAIMEKANTTTDDAEQTKLYKQAAKLLTETAANVYIQDLADFVLINADLGRVSVLSPVCDGPVYRPLCPVCLTNWPLGHA